MTDFPTVPTNPPTPIQVLGDLLEKAEYDKEKDLYTMRLTGDAYRQLTKTELCDRCKEPTPNDWSKYVGQVLCFLCHTEEETRFQMQQPGAA